VTYTAAPPFTYTSGPRGAKLMIVGEAWGEQEDMAKAPFIGSSGQELTRLLNEAGIDRLSCLLTNVLPFRPPENKLEAICTDKKSVGPGYLFPALSNGKYLLPEYLCEIPRLQAEIRACNPNLVVAMGNMACWALLRTPKISAIRGATTYANFGRADGSSFKVLPTFHPAYILRAWQDRTIVLADLMKAKREAEFPDVRRPHREVLIDPTLAEIAEWIARPAMRYAVDVETTKRQIDMIGLARTPQDMLVVPFVDYKRPDNCYWPTLDEEMEARRLLNIPLMGPVPKLFQNGLYDMQYMLREGFRLRNVDDDCMLLHHSMWPEMKKGLGFMGSVHTDEASWKLMRLDHSNKRDE
jgi:uracil-DNA glycosylase